MRILQVISAQHFIPHGGTGQFCRTFTQMARFQGWVVDLAFDKAPADTEWFGEDVLCFSPRNPVVSYSNHSNAFAFNESLNFEKMINFRESILNALGTCVYDMIVVNTPDAIMPLYALGIQDYVPIVFYTHNEHMVFSENHFKGVFNDSYNECITNFVRSSGIIVGTQTQRNVEEILSKGFSNRVEYLPMPLPERGLLEKYEGDKSGVLFIGRWEDRKNPKEFIRVIQETKLPAKVMTNANGAKKFKAALDEIGATYEIKASIVGQEKVDFIRSSALFYMPSKSESFGFALYECLGHMPCVVLEDYPWYKNFGIMPHATSKYEVVGLIQKLYGKDENYMDWVQKNEKFIPERWYNVVDAFDAKSSNNTSANIHKHDNVWLSDYIQSLARQYSIEDIISVLANKGKFQLKQDRHKGTFLTTTGQEPIIKTNTLWDFFN